MKKKHIPNFTAILAIIIGVLCSSCLIAPILIAAGLGSVLFLIVPWLAPLFLLLIGISIIGFIVSYHAHKNPLPFILALLAAGLMYYGRYVSYSDTAAYLGGTVLIGAIAYDWYIRKNNKKSMDCAIELPVKKNERV
jgi:O-antigen/teichoic acid export membrane protein